MVPRDARTRGAAKRDWNAAPADLGGTHALRVGPTASAGSLLSTSGVDSSRFTPGTVATPYAVQQRTMGFPENFGIPARRSPQAIRSAQAKAQRGHAQCGERAKHQLGAWIFEVASRSGRVNKPSRAQAGHGCAVTSVFSRQRPASRAAPRLPAAARLAHDLEGLRTVACSAMISAPSAANAAVDAPGISALGRAAVGQVADARPGGQRQGCTTPTLAERTKPEHVGQRVSDLRRSARCPHATVRPGLWPSVLLRANRGRQRNAAEPGGPALQPTGCGQGPAAAVGKVHWRARRFRGQSQQLTARGSSASTSRPLAPRATRMHRSAAAPRPRRARHAGPGRAAGRRGSGRDRNWSTASKTGGTVSLRRAPYGGAGLRCPWELRPRASNPRAKFLDPTLQAISSGKRPVSPLRRPSPAMPPHAWLVDLDGRSTDRRPSPTMACGRFSALAPPNFGRKACEPRIWHERLHGAVRLCRIRSPSRCNAAGGLGWSAEDWSDWSRIGWSIGLQVAAPLPAAGADR